MKVLISHTAVDSGGDPSPITKVVDTDDQLDFIIAHVIATGYCEWGCEDQEYEDFRNALENLPDIVFPVTIDEIIVDSTQEY